MDSTVLVAGITIVPATIAAINATKAKRQTNGALHEPLARIEAKIEDLLGWQIKHERRHESGN